MSTPKVFISYSHSDRDGRANSLRRSLAWA